METFKKGELVRYKTTTILVTGEGKKEHYPTFAGVVVEELETSSLTPKGTYSTTWNFNAFHKILNKIKIM